MSVPPDDGPPPETWLERQIREAMEETPLHLLPGAGKPIADLTGYDQPDWWAKRLLERERAAEEEQAIAEEIRTTLRFVWRIPDEGSLCIWIETINARIDALPAGHAARPLDRDEIVRRWRAATG